MSTGAVPSTSTLPENVEPHARSPQIKPTPAAAPSPTGNDNPGRSLQGVLKIVLDDPNKNCYVKFTQSFCDLTTEARDAIRVRCNFVSGATLLERMVSIDQINNITAFFN